MIPHKNYEIYASVLFFIVAKFICCAVEYFRTRSMHKKQNFNLSSIPENNEQEDMAGRDWVSKKKHDVLKAKYKCLKKLFQIYDATLVGILPENETDTVDTVDTTEENEPTGRRRKKRSYLTKTDAFAGTTESSNGDMTEVPDTEKCSVTTSVAQGLNINQSLTITQVESDTKSIATSKDVKYASTQDSRENTSILTQGSRDSISSYPSTVRECPCAQTAQINPIPMQNPYLVVNERRKLTRFQSFIQRILGIRPEKNYKPYMLPNGQICSFSDNNIYHYRGDKRRRRRLRFRRFRRTKKVHSEGSLRDKSPAILTYVQSVQRSCLMDTTPRQCPIVGCRTMFYGIINYNDHLNLCHFTERKYICHYCHEGFENEFDKYVHENEHIGITKLSMASSFNTPIMSGISNNTNYNNNACNNTNGMASICMPTMFNNNNLTNNTKASDTQTEPAAKSEVPDDKLKKIVSFFDKIVDSRNSNQYFNEMKKQFSSECNINNSTCTGSKTSSNEEKRTVSCTDTSQNCATTDSERCTKRDFEKCHFCGEVFDNRRQLSMHVDIEHRVHNKFSKFHSCVGIMRDNRKKIDSNTLDLCKSGQIQVESVYSTNEMCNSSFEESEESKAESEHALSYNGSSNIICFSSMDSINKNNQKNVNKPGIHSYKWKPGTKIIRV